MKKILAIALLIFGVITINAQNYISINFNQNFSTFRFKDSGGNVTDLAYTVKYGYGASFQRVFNNQFFVEGFLAYNIKGANSTLEGELLDWSFHYLNAGGNAGYRLNFGKLYPFGGAGIYYGRLLRADQLIGTTYYNLMSTGNVKKNDFGLNLFAGLEYEYSSNGSVFTRINESVGLLQLEKGENVTQKMFNRTFSIQLGLKFTIEKITKN
jgi:hypothetical protein